MRGLRVLKSVFVGGASVVALTGVAHARVYDIPDGDLSTALSAFIKQSNAEIVYVDDVVRGHKSRGAKGDYTETAALSQILKGTGLKAQAMTSSSAIEIVPQEPAAPATATVLKVAQATRPGAPPPPQQSGLETVVVTAQKKSEDIQTVPIAITAMSQQQLTERQVAGGPDLVKEIPNLTFSKTNFTGYNLEIRGIGTQAISVTTDPAVAVAFNDIPFIRNHFFEQEFFDVQDVEVLRGPQGTLYGRNATAGVVDLKSALPTDEYESMLSADIGNYSNRRLEGMINIPIVGDKLDIRMAGEWTKRDGYTEDQELGVSVDGRDLWSGRLSIGFNPSERLHSTFVWERFSEDDDRMRSAKQLCEKDPGPTSIDGLNLLAPNPRVSPSGQSLYSDFERTWLSQGCLPTSLYSPNAYETPNGQTLPFVELGEFIVSTGSSANGGLLNPVDPYSNQTQPMNLRTIQSLILPHYRAKNDTLEYNLTYALTPELTLISATGYNNDFLYSTEDFNRFDTAPGIFAEGLNGLDGQPSPVLPNGVYCDPQLGCSSSMVAEDLSQERSSQFNQEVRVSSSFKGPLNFSLGTNYTHYQTVEDYYVFFNILSAFIQRANHSGPGLYDSCNPNPNVPGFLVPPTPFLNPYGQVGHDGGVPADIPSLFSCNTPQEAYGYVGTYVDPNPLGSIDGEGHNYFRSENPYQLNSWAGFGEVYYDVTPQLKLTGGLRWTDDRKVFDNIPSAVFELGGGYPITSIVKQGWDEWTGRANAAWSPELDFTDQSMFYASYAHGYKGGGANPPGPVADVTSAASYSTHPLTFAPEHIEAFEIGTKNSALDNTLTFNGDIFFYNYHGYQISQIVDRTSINLNFNATVEGAELESTWEPLPGLKFNLAGGWEDSAVDKNQYAIDLMDRTGGVPGWVVVRPFVSETSNCILPAAVVAQIMATNPSFGLLGGGISHACDAAYGTGLGIFGHNSTLSAIFADNGFNPAAAPNNGQGFAKDLAGNKLPNMPPFTLSTGAQYSMPVNGDWAATFRADFYWQGNTYARIFNDKPYDDIHGYTNLNVALMLDSQNGWDVMAYVKNVFDVTAITGAFLNSDDTALTTNVFVTDPRLFGVRVTKHLDEGDGFWGSDWSGADWIKDIFSNSDSGRPPLWIELGGNFDQLADGGAIYQPSFLSKTPAGLPSPLGTEKPLGLGLDWETEVSFQPDGSDWIATASARYGRAAKNEYRRQQTNALPTEHVYSGYVYPDNFAHRFAEAQVQNAETHAIIDFMIGKNVGLGSLGMPGTGVLSGGVRYAEFTSRTDVALGLDPDSADGPGAPMYHFHQFNGAFSASRNFRGIGPSISLKASTPLSGDLSDGQFTFDWGGNGAVLFGRQKARGSHSTRGAYYCENNAGGAPTGCPARTANAAPFAIGEGFRQISNYQHTKSFNRSRMVVVPNIGAFAGISYRLSNAKVSFGYRADEFFGAMDGGIDSYKAYNRGFFGPFANISIGLGG